MNTGPFGVIAVSETTPSLSGLAASFNYKGEPVSNSNPLPIGESTSGLLNFTSGGVNGIQYKIVVSLTLTNGQVDTGSVTITAKTQ